MSISDHQFDTKNIKSHILDDYKHKMVALKCVYDKKAYKLLYQHPLNHALHACHLIHSYDKLIKR